MRNLSETALPTQPAEVRFVEAKSLDLGRVGEILAVSASENHWANFGPVSRMLERRLEEVLRVRDEHGVVVASSATSALFALAGVAAHRLQRPLKWIGSAYAFRATVLGPFVGDIHLVDCDPQGFLDLDEARRLPTDSWDGMLVTNLFGARGDLAPYVAFCGERGKALIADNALALFGFDRESDDAPEEVISFHHTKPWGFGEGGCAILLRQDVDLFRKLLSFGHQAPPALESFAANGKVSDVSAAAILQRLDQASNWAPQYAEQGRRIAQIAARAGYTIFAEPPPRGLFGFVPALAPRPVSIDEIRASRLPLARYYPPLAELPNARAIWQRMVCVPSHPGMAALSDGEIEDHLGSLLARSKAA